MPDDKTYDVMPEKREHFCHAVNAGGTPVEWVIYDERNGFQLWSTNAYGDGMCAVITFCPWCGEKLMRQEHEEAMSEHNKLTRRGIRV